MESAIFVRRESPEHEMRLAHLNHGGARSDRAFVVLAVPSRKLRRRNLREQLRSGSPVVDGCRGDEHGHEQAQRIDLITSRNSTSRGRPRPSVAGGDNNGSKMFHWSFVRSEG